MMYLTSAVPLIHNLYEQCILRSHLQARAGVQLARPRYLSMADPDPAKPVVEPSGHGDTVTDACPAQKKARTLKNMKSFSSDGALYDDEFDREFALAYDVDRLFGHCSPDDDVTDSREGSGSQAVQLGDSEVVELVGAPMDVVETVGEKDEDVVAQAGTVSEKGEDVVAEVDASGFVLHLPASGTEPSTPCAQGSQGSQSPGAAWALGSDSSAAPSTSLVSCGDGDSGSDDAEDCVQDVGPGQVEVEMKTGASAVGAAVPEPAPDDKREASPLPSEHDRKPLRFVRGGGRPADHVSTAFVCAAPSPGCSDDGDPSDQEPGPAFGLRRSAATRPSVGPLATITARPSVPDEIKWWSDCIWDMWDGGRRKLPARFSHVLNVDLVCAGLGVEMLAFEVW